MGYNFMNNEDYEQISVKGEIINGVDFLKESDMVEVVVHAESETVLYVDLPAHTVLEVTYTEPGLKGDTSTNSLKPCTVETGATVRVPLFINTGDKIKVDTRDGSYIERVK
jgi:elongation factor P